MQRSNLIIETAQKSPTKKDSKNSFMNGNANGNDKPILMTRRELNDPFGSDEEDERDTKNRKKSPPKELISPPPVIDDVSFLCSLVAILIELYSFVLSRKLSIVISNRVRKQKN
jgi:hypothetical protein